MCITLSAAELSNTKLYAGEAQRGDRYVHVLAYQNQAATAGPNAMILPIPAAVMPGRQNVIDTRPFARFLTEIHAATQIPSFGPPDGSRSLDMFEVGSYTVLLAEKPSAIAELLSAVPEQKRPALNPAILSAFEQLYPGSPVAVCCWDGSFEAEPLLWWYEPKTPDWLFAPALDAHGGKPPDTSAQVWVDHHVAFGSTLRPQGSGVYYRSPIPPEVRALLPSQVRGTRVYGQKPNGDFWIPTAALGGPAQRCAPRGQAMAIPLDGW